MSKVTFVNNNWNHVNVVGVRGNMANCSDNSGNDDFSFSLTINQSQDVSYDGWGTLCYQRDNDPDHPDGTYNGYTQLDDLGEDRTEEL